MPMIKHLMSRNWVAHNNKPGHDKIYIACVRQLPNGRWLAMGKWGKRTQASLTTQVKGGEVNSERAAAVTAQALFAEKLKGGYVDICSHDYDGPVTVKSVRHHLEDDPCIVRTLE